LQSAEEAGASDRNQTFRNGAQQTLDLSIGELELFQPGAWMHSQA